MRTASGKWCWRLVVGGFPVQEVRAHKWHWWHHKGAAHAGVFSTFGFSGFFFRGYTIPAKCSRLLGMGVFLQSPLEVVPWLPARNCGAQLKVWTCVTAVVEVWMKPGLSCFSTYCTLLHLKYQVGLGELSGAITKRRKKPHLCGGCDKLVILYLQIANYSSDWLLSDQFACAVMVTGLQIRCRISCGSDVAFSSCSLGSKMHGWGVLCNSLLLAALFFHSQSFFRLERNKMAHSCSLVFFYF